MAEKLVLDPAAAAVNRTDWDITQYVAAAGPDWGDAAIEQYLADIENGAVPVDFRIPNRVVTIPLLLLKSSSGTAYTFDQVRRRFQQKAALFQRKGGWIERTVTRQVAPGDFVVKTVYADVIGAQLKLGGGTAQALWGIDADAVLILTCLPDWYGDEVDLGTFTGATGELAAMIGTVEGDYPARARMQVKDTAGKRRHGLLWAHRYYNAAPTAQLLYSAYQMTLLNGAKRVQASTGDDDVAGTYVKAAGIDAVNWVTVISTDIPVTGPLTHEGTYRVWARVANDLRTATSVHRIRLRWDVGDFTKATTNPAVTMPKCTVTDPGLTSQGAQGIGMCLIDLGEVYLEAPPVGGHRWRGEVQIASQSANFFFDKLYFAPVATGYGKLIASDIESDVGDIGILAGFRSQPLGTALNGIVVTGGTWSSTGGAPDFTAVSESGTGTSGDVVARATTTGGARVAIAGALTYTAVDIQVDVKIPAAPLSAPFYESSLFARYTDASHNVELRFINGGVTPGLGDVSFAVRVTGPGAIGAGLSIAEDHPNWPRLSAGWATMRLVIDTTGRYFGWMVPRGAGFGEPSLVGQAPVLATAGGLASGKVGFGTGNVSSGSIMVDNFIVKTPPVPDAVIYENRSAEVRYDGVYRESTDGFSGGRVAFSIGDLLRLPPSGMEGRQVEMLVRPTRGDFGYMPDFDQSGPMTARVLYRPCYLFVP